MPLTISLLSHYLFSPHTLFLPHHFLTITWGFGFFVRLCVVCCLCSSFFLSFLSFSSFHSFLFSFFSFLFFVFFFLVVRYLRNRTIEVVPATELMRFALEAAAGLAHLTSQGIVHRDVSARNCLINEGLVLKIADYGLGVDTAELATLQQPASEESVEILPLRWMSPESLQRAVFNSATDVWAFGVLLWEIFNFGQDPYSWMSNREVSQPALREKINKNKK
jgi:serine/threonine protein kinase